MASLTDAAPAPRSRLARARRLHLWLALLMVVIGALSLGAGATGVNPQAALWRLARGLPLDRTEVVVLLDIRLPRLVMGLLVGAALAVSGALMQGLFRNPLADPGIVGVSAGAGLGAISNTQMQALRGGADIIVATPGRLLDLISSNAIKLDKVTTLVLDEADRMLSLGFTEELAELSTVPGG